MNFQEKVVWFFGLKSVRYTQIFIVVMGDLLALANLYPKHCRYIQRPFLVWKDKQTDKKYQ
ncbi:uncharacterized protein LOC110189680 [Drosophila serrata]|uniref:uncharacterized protein LOC110189680 n=1 Tax=Drosophila serrata TaxID=7274 RepID=UPI000A1D32F9|nr:uncharacterized protein LOC110189680 [Drosophila serrata]KAH8389857.1 hypothetical protein KR200_002832 [Drosophila serrata]